MSILDDIYAGRYSVGHPPGDISREVLDQDAAFWEEAESILGEEAVEEQQKRACDISFEEERNAFREGFRLGVLLMLELL